jgi:FAD/FMN-containing dehydrogenase
MIGATLGGGLGRYNGLHGMLLDSLLSVKMITADGDIIKASGTMNKDLFWAIRGAEFDFGTILEATYTIYDETASLVLNADFLFAPNASREILSFFKSFENDLPAKLSLVLLAGYASDLGGVSPLSLSTSQNLYSLISRLVILPSQRSLCWTSSRGGGVPPAIVESLAEAYQFHHDLMVINQCPIILCLRAGKFHLPHRQQSQCLLRSC